MKKIASALFLFISMAVMTLPAFADPIDTYDLTFTGGTSPAYGGFQIASYNFSVSKNGGTPFTEAMTCIDYNREISNGESWTASLVPISSPDPSDPAPVLTVTELQELAILNNQMLAATNLTDKTNYQYAIWSFSANPTQLADLSQFNTIALGYAAAAVTDVTTHNAIYAANAPTFVNYAYFDPTSWLGSPATNVDPQRFLVYAPPGNDIVVPRGGTSPVPEPSSLMMLGTGVLGLASVARRRFKA